MYPTEVWYSVFALLTILCIIKDMCSPLSRIYKLLKTIIHPKQSYKPDIAAIETELKKRWDFPYTWGRKQNDKWDSFTNFIYDIDKFDILIDTVKITYMRMQSPNISYDDFLDYTLNRWYNYWSALAIESIFCSMPGVMPNKNKKDKFVDFTVNNISFDHKSSVFPAAYPGNIDYAMHNPSDIIKWLYKNQSQGHRMHLHNRLFVIMYAKNRMHWRLKAEIAYIGKFIRQYINEFNPEKLHKIHFQNNRTALSDIIWVVKDTI